MTVCVCFVAVEAIPTSTPAATATAVLTCDDVDYSWCETVTTGREDETCLADFGLFGFRFDGISGCTVCLCAEGRGAVGFVVVDCGVVVLEDDRVGFLWLDRGDWSCSSCVSC